VIIRKRYLDEVGVIRETIPNKGCGEKTENKTGILGNNAEKRKNL
jgi:hypothetical protein